MFARLRVIAGENLGAECASAKQAFVLALDTKTNVHFNPVGTNDEFSKKGSVFLQSDSWHLQIEKGEPWFVDNTRISNRKPVGIKSGSVIRFSAFGPDVRFDISSTPFPENKSGQANSSQVEIGEELKVAPLPNANTASSLATASNTESDESITEGQPKSPASLAPLLQGSIALVLLLTLGYLLSPILFPRNADTPTNLARVQDADETKAGETESQVSLPKQDAEERKLETNAESELKTETPAKNNDDAPQPLSNEQLQEAIVWFGFRQEGFVVPKCTGWAISENEIVCPGPWLAYMKKDNVPGREYFVYSKHIEGEFAEILEYRMHPDFLKGSIGSAIAIAKISKPVNFTLNAKNSASVDHFESIRIAGYHISSDPAKVKAFNRYQRPPFQVLPANVTNVQVIDKIPIVRFDEESIRGLDGSPVIDKEGTVVGILDYPRLYFTDGLKELTAYDFSDKKNK